MTENNKIAAPETLPQNLNLYDLTDIEILSKNDDALFGKVLNILISMFSSEIENVKILAKDDKWKEVAEIVHKLKTSLTHIRVVSLKQTVKDLEDYEQFGSEKLNRLATEFCDALENMLIYLKIDLVNFNKK